MQVHTFASTGEAYDASQTHDDIHDGDVLAVPNEQVYGLLVKAWPVAVAWYDDGNLCTGLTPENIDVEDEGPGAFHVLDPAAGGWGRVEDGRYLDAALTALRLATEPQTWYVHEYEEWQQYGGPEEGGWWYTNMQPTGEEPIGPFFTEEAAYEACRERNIAESNRRDGLTYGFTSVLSHREDFYGYTVETLAIPTEGSIGRPHYE